MANRLEVARSLIEGAADHLLGVGAIGVAGLIDVPGGPGIRFARGATDLSGRTPLTGTERFFAASQTKMLTAAAILHLCGDGALSIDDHVAARWPAATGAGIPPEVTIRQLLNHTSGIGNFSDYVQGTVPPTYPASPPLHVCDDDLILLGRIRGQQFGPGTSWAYNNTGYIVLGRIIESVSGMAVPAFIRDRLLAPLGMTGTTFARRGWSADNLCAGYFEPFGRRGTVLSVPDAFGDLSMASSAGDMISTLDDMAAWLRALVGGRIPGGPTLADFLGDVVDAWATAPDWMVAPSYALGVERVVLGGRPMWGHMGTTVGYRSGSFICPESGLLVAMFMTFVHRPDAMAHIALQAKRQELMSTMAALGASLLG